MGAPKKKPTRMKRDQRRAHFKATVPNLIECPHCHELIPSHTFVLTVDGMVGKKKSRLRRKRKAS